MSKKAEVYQYVDVSKAKQLRLLSHMGDMFSMSYLFEDKTISLHMTKEEAGLVLSMLASQLLPEELSEAVSDHIDNMDNSDFITPQMG